MRHLIFTRFEITMKTTVFGVMRLCWNCCSGAEITNKDKLRNTKGKSEQELPESNYFISLV